MHILRHLQCRPTGTEHRLALSEYPQFQPLFAYGGGVSRKTVVGYGSRYQKDLQSPDRGKLDVELLEYATNGALPEVYDGIEDEVQG